VKILIWRISGSFRDFLSAFDPQFRGHPALGFNAVIMSSTNVLQSIGGMITEVGRSAVEMANQQTLDILENAIDKAINSAQDAIGNILANSSGRGTHKLKETSAGRIKTTIDLVIELDGQGELKPMLVAGVSLFHQKPTKIGIIELSVGLRQTFDISLLPGNPISNFINVGGLLGVIRDTMTTMAFAIVAKLSWVVADVGILLRRDLMDFSNRNIRPTINWNTISDDWIAGVQFTIGNRRFEWRANISDWGQGRR